MRTRPSSLLPRTLLAAAALTLLLALPAAAQHSRQQVHWTHNDRSVRMEVIGEVEFSDDDTEVVRLSPGGRFTLEERRPGGPWYRIEYTGAGAELRQAFFVDDRPRALDAEGRAWLAAILPEVARETTVGAQRRIEGIVARRGVGGAIEEIERIRSDGVKRVYYLHLLRRPELDSRARAQALRSAGRTIGSDGDKASLLVRAAATDPLRSEAVRRSYFQAAGTIRSDGDRRRVLTAALRPETATPAVAVEALRSAAGMRSDGDTAGVLLAVPARLLADPGVRRAYQETARTLRSDGDRTRALNHLSRHTPPEQMRRESP